MQIKNFQFHPSLLGVVVTTIAVAVFSYLSVWQIGRAEERKLLREEVVERSAMPVAEFNVTTASLDTDRYKRFTVSGQFLNQHQLLLDNRVVKGRVGYQVISPFRTDGGPLVLIDRGWVPADRDRRILPEIPVTEEPQVVEVMLDKPRSVPVVADSPVESLNRWNYLDVAHYSQLTGLNVPEYVLLLSADTGPGYERHWPEIEDKSGMHIGYAIQWAAFAVVALGTFIGLSFKRIKQ